MTQRAYRNSAPTPLYVGRATANVKIKTMLANETDTDTGRDVGNRTYYG